MVYGQLDNRIKTGANTPTIAPIIPFFTALLFNISKGICYFFKTVGGNIYTLFLSVVYNTSSTANVKFFD